MTERVEFNFKCKLQDIPKIFWKCFTSISEYFFVKNFKCKKTPLLMQNNNMYTYKDKLGQSFIMTEASSKKCVK